MTNALQPHHETVLLPDEMQRRASDPTKSVWVSASAGSGKTKVLADRVLRLLLSGVKPHKILCLTFTRAAATQMSIRITGELSKWATCTDQKLSDDLAKLQNIPPEIEQLEKARCLFAEYLNSPGGMRIRTIHAFCQEILRRFPLEAGVSPQFVVLEEADANALYHEALQEVWRAATNHPEEPVGKALRLLADTMGETTLTKLLAEAGAEPEKIVEAHRKSPKGEDQKKILGFAAADTQESLVQQALTPPVFREKEIRAAAKVIAEHGSKTFSDRGNRILDWLSLPQDARLDQADSYIHCFLTKEDSPNKEVMNKELVQKHPQHENLLREEALRMESLVERLETLRLIDQTAALSTLVVCLYEKFALLKTARAALDYNDLIRKASQLLQQEDVARWVLYKLDAGLEHILVDEAQDTSPEQWQIVHTLSNEFFSGLSARSDVRRTLFVVGDRKQSIYSFMKADPATFEKMRVTFRKLITEMDPTSYHEQPLTISFRSAPAILKAVDHVFATPEARSGVSDTEIHHEAWHKEAQGRVELWPLVAPPEKAKKEDEEEETWQPLMVNATMRKPAVELADRIADKIKAWLSGGLTLRGRAVRPDDIMILVRKRAHLVDPLVRALKKRDIPVSGVDRMTLIEQIAVMDLLALIQFVLLPEDSLNLACVLKGPLLGFTDDHLMAIALDRENASLWQSLLARSSKEPAFQKAVDYLQGWLALADKRTPFAFLAQILDQACPADDQGGKRALWSRLGADALDPLNELLNAAQSFGENHPPSLQGFLHWITATESQIKRELDQGGGYVRITTVHTSKGLEAPIIILPDTVSVPEDQGLPKIVWGQNGTVPFYVPRAVKNSTLGALRAELKQKQMEEYRRLLYVALTRAADHLYVAGFENKKEQKAELSWYDLIRKGLSELHDPTLVAEGAVIAFEDSVVSKAKMASTEISSSKPTPIPEWAKCRPPLESQRVLTLTPSRSEPALASPDDRRFVRGRIIHRLLQSLPDVAVDLRQDKIQRFLAAPHHLLSDLEQLEMAVEVQTLLNNPDFAPFFAAGSRAEVSLVGWSNNQRIVGQVDRLCLVKNGVWIVDYKTNRPPPEKLEDLHPSYQRQMELYRTVLRGIYPDREIRCFLLWTYGARLMEIP